jgi:hypothetical protein
MYRSSLNDLTLDHLADDELPSTYRERSFCSLGVSCALAPTVSWWKTRVKGVLNGCRNWRDVGESEARGAAFGRNETVGRLMDRVANRFAGTCIARRDIVNPSIDSQTGLARWA